MEKIPNYGGIMPLLQFVKSLRIVRKLILGLIFIKRRDTKTAYMRLFAKRELKIATPVESQDVIEYGKGIECAGY